MRANELFREGERQPAPYKQIILPGDPQKTSSLLVGIKGSFLGIRERADGKVHARFFHAPTLFGQSIEGEAPADYIVKSLEGETASIQRRGGKPLAPDVTLFLERSERNDIAYLNAGIQAMGVPDTRRRIINTFKFLALSPTQDSPKVTGETLAALIGRERVTVSMNLSALLTQGILRREKQSIYRLEGGGQEGGRVSARSYRDYAQTPSQLLTLLEIRQASSPEEKLARAFYLLTQEGSPLLRQGRIAALIGLSRMTVNAYLGLWQQEGFIQTSGSAKRHQYELTKEGLSMIEQVEAAAT